MTDRLRLATQVYQTLLAENGSDPTEALMDLSMRYVAAWDGVSPGFLRMGMNDASKDIKFDAPPVDDGSWIETGRDSAANPGS